MIKLAASLLVCLLATASWAITTDFTITVATTFVPLHTYYLSPTGSDAADGLAPTAGGGHGPWFTPQHPVVCGDVIIAIAGTYPFYGDGDFGTVSNCPSTSGGIDGSGGIYFAIILCGGSSVGDCQINGGNFEAFSIDKSNWAVEGWKGTQNSDGRAGCFGGLAQGGTERNYIAFVNNIASGCDLDGFHISGGGGSPGVSSFDHAAAVGVVSFNAAQSNQGLCGSGISMIPGNADSSPGTHIYIDGYFGYFNTNVGCTAGGSPPHSDGEGIIFDTYGNGYTTSGFDKPVVLRNAVIWKSGGSCVEIFPNGATAANDKAQYTIENVTCYSNNQDSQAFCSAELFYNQVSPTGTGTSAARNNIFLATSVSSCVPSSVSVTHGAWISTRAVKTNPPLTVESNYIWSSKAPTNTTAAANNLRVDGSNSTMVFGTNTYNDPGLASPASLPSTAPDCSGYTNTTDCMNAKYGVYGHVTPTIAPSTMGYQPPGPCVASDPLYPVWLKGIVYLRHMGGGVIAEFPGLITKPCNM